MNELASSLPAAAVKAFSTGVIASTLAPFTENGTLMVGNITDPASRLARLEGILGIAVNTTARERDALTRTERLQVIRRTREALGREQFLLAGFGALSEGITDEVDACRHAGVDAVIASLPRLSHGTGAQAIDSHLTRLTELVDSLALPIIIAYDGDGAIGHKDGLIDDHDQIAALARNSCKVIGAQIGTHNNVLHYDQSYYALKTIDRPLACLASSEAALFHNLNTGADGVLSCLAYVAPHEIAALYSATKAGKFYEAQALHNRLSPLIGLISGHDRITREMVLRRVAHRRGLLAADDARGIDRPFDLPITRAIEQALEDIALKPIDWVR